MSAIEKQLNRGELNAYKAFDNSNTYALVPGVSSVKRGATSLTPHKEAAYHDPEAVKKKVGSESLKNNYERMAKYGLQNISGGGHLTDQERHFRG